MGETATTAQRSFAQKIRLYPALLDAGRFWAYCGAATSASGCFYAFLGGAPYVRAKVFGLQPSAIGLTFALPAMGYAAGNFVAGDFSMRFGMNPMVVVGTMITTCGMALLAVMT